MILAGEHAGAGQRARFLAEARAIARLNHPNIVQVYEVGEHQGRAFMALEFCAGGSLDQLLREKPPTPREAAEMVAELARAVQAAHEAGVVHRDLKPANVLVAANGTLKVTDFGLAKMLDEAGPTQPGDVMGTPGYMPPELADVYALGAILYECLTGQPPFRGASLMETLRRVREDDPVPPCRLRPDVPAGLEEACLRCLEKDPIHRYQSAGELAAALCNFLHGGPSERHPTAAARRLEADLYAKQLALAEREWAAGRPQNAAVHLNACPVGLRGWEWRCLRGLRGRPLTLREHTDRVYGVAFSPDGKLLATAAWDRTVRIWDVASGAAVHVLRGHTNWVWSVAFAPDGERLVSGSTDRTVRVWDLVGGAAPLVINAHDLKVLGVAFSPDGRLIASAGGDGAAKLWDAHTGAELRPLKGHADRVTGIAFDPDGSFVATASEDQTVRLWDVHTGAELRTFLGHARRVNAVAFSPSGGHLASASDDGAVLLWRTGPR